MYPDFPNEPFSEFISSNLDDLGRLPYEVVQAGFNAYWSSCGFSECGKSAAEVDLVKAINRSIAHLSVDPELQPDLAIQRTFVSDRLANAAGKIAALVEFMNHEGNSCLWYADKVSRIEAGSARLAVITTPRSEVYQLHVLLDDKAFQSELRRINDYHIDLQSVEIPVSVQVASNWLRQMTGKLDIEVLHIQEFGEYHRASTTGGNYDIEFSCHLLSRLLTCRFHNCTV